METRVSLKHFVDGCLWKHFFASTFNPDPFKLNLFDNYGNSKAFHSFNLKLEQLSSKKVLKFALLCNCFSDLFTEVEIWY